MPLPNHLTRWQWTGLASFLAIAILTVLQYRPSHMDSKSVSGFIHNGSPVTGQHPGAASTNDVPGVTSKLHLLMPASGKHFRLCRALASATILGYPVPVMNGWMKEGELDASKTHLAKVRTVMQYLDSLPPSSDEDLVLMVDGYDIVFQIPPDVLIDRYFATVRTASAKLAARFGVHSVDSLVGPNSPRQTILFGPEKICYPVQWGRVGCWAIPEDIDIPPGAFGPDDGQMSHNLPRWLNSGTIMGPAKDMRKLFAATLDRIAETYDPNHQFSDSDQMYMSDIWGVQEFGRSIEARRLYFHGDVDPNDVVPTGGETKTVPTLSPGQQTEYHIGIDYRSALFQTRVGSDHALAFLAYNETNETGDTTYATVFQNISEYTHFKPYKIELPSNLASSITRVLQSIKGVITAIPHVTELRLDTNVVTKNVYGLFHCTGDKDYIDDLWAKLWYYPYARPLFEAAIPSLKAGRSLGIEDGRAWLPAHTLPSNSSEAQGINATGAWTGADGEWVAWQDICGDFEDEVFGNQ
ncbi:hypothetical protein N7462_002876 [Penicillium macrosclerotiorum]|uniref:uncharacterized protein n=1 Tax=Penicillium macrosclerotiorum TaxID=303699 RepID=UPI002548DFAD|nr:uncharacterized protein N7462_002876 [Penicillium macrosclerotiorum]KAJ5693453.1 hypothetical protein N7462_002876 [Penicillium macrosclerotiorum]